MKTGDPKYDIENNQLVNAFTREPIPSDEPIFILRAKDIHARGTIGDYGFRCLTAAQKHSVRLRRVEFDNFAAERGERMKEPDTDTMELSGGCPGFAGPGD